MHWDGRDEFGRLVPPGFYLCRVRVQVHADEAGPTSAARAIAVAYYPDRPGLGDHRRAAGRTPRHSIDYLTERSL